MVQINNARAIRDVELILHSGSQDYEARCWTAAGAECRRDRHRYTGQGYAFSVEILRLRHAGRAPWEVMIVTEQWAAGMPETVIRSHKWMKIVAGSPADVRMWIRRHRPAGITCSAAEEVEGASLDI